MTRPRVPDFTAAEILAEIERATPDVGIVTLASELDGGLDLVRWLSSRGHRVSLGHSGATYEEALAAIEAGARQATHLFNSHARRWITAHLGWWAPVLQAEETAAEMICDGFHVHPAVGSEQRDCRQAPVEDPGDFRCDGRRRSAGRIAWQCSAARRLRLG